MNTVTIHLSVSLVCRIRETVQGGRVGENYFMCSLNHPQLRSESFLCARHLRNTRNWSLLMGRIFQWCKIFHIPNHPSLLSPETILYSYQLLLLIRELWNLYCTMDLSIKGTVLTKRFDFCWHERIEIRKNKRRGRFLYFLIAPMIKNTKFFFLLVNANCYWFYIVSSLLSSSDCRYAFVLVICRPFQRQNWGHNYLWGAASVVELK